MMIDDCRLMIVDSPYRIRHSISNWRGDIEILKDVPEASPNGESILQFFGRPYPPVILFMSFPLS